MTGNAILESLFKRQMETWPEARQRYDGLKEAITKEFNLNGMTVRAQFNPARAVSTLAVTGREATSARPCFLCGNNRPAQQEALPFTGRNGRQYEILVNPFPIFPVHFTVASASHVPQRIAERFPDMLLLAEAFPGYVIFYNGPESGASAPDHFHFQMGCKGFLPVETDFERLAPVTVMRPGEAVIAASSAYIPGLPVITAGDMPSAATAFLRILQSLPASPASGEPPLNILCWKEKDTFRAIIIPRKAHRPSCYSAPENSRVRISPGSADIGGVFIVPVEDDFRRTDAGVLSTIIGETVGPSWQPAVNVGLLKAENMDIIFDGEFSVTAHTGCRSGNPPGEETVSIMDGKAVWRGKAYDRLKFEAASGFTLRRVKIGIDFHWEREEDQAFNGSLEIIPDDDGLTAVNSIPVEDYLVSVISSEMNGNAPEEFLKAHAVISRSWLLARPTFGGHAPSSPGKAGEGTGQGRAGNRIIRWRDRCDHTLFDVCADDHCQRYQGMLRAVNGNIRKAVESTRGLVLTSEEDNTICDTRFSKCCGGITERFSTCWEDKDFSYLQPVRDHCCPEIPDLSEESRAREWIMSRPDSFCNTSDKSLLSTVLNDYDMQTGDFYRWKAVYSQAELSELLRSRSGIDFGSILSLTPVRRGASGRITELLITGTKCSVTVGKELEIRRWLSATHLYSSAFVTDTEGNAGSHVLQDGKRIGIPARFILHGAGWGHGVGLCQTGAAVMGLQGRTFEHILYHYFPGTRLTQLY